MNTNRTFPARRTRGYALMLTLMLTTVTLIVLVACLRLTSGECRLTARHNAYNNSVAAAEAGTERVLAQMERDFFYQSVNANLSTYGTLIPDQTGWPTQYEFSDGVGNTGQSRVTSGGSTVATNLPSWAVLNSAYSGLYGLVVPYQVISRATSVNTIDQVSAGVAQDFQLARIPVFQFAIFYNMDLEINPGPDMTINGKVHSNADLYTAPGATLIFQSDVTSVGNIYRRRHPDDPNQSVGNNPNYIGAHDEKVSSMSLPIGTNNSPPAITAILDMPPFGEDPNSALGKLRLYNNADLIVSNNASGDVSVKTGLWNNFADVPADVVKLVNIGTPSSPNYVTNKSYSFVTNVTYYDFREKKTVQATQIDVNQLKAWMANTATNGGAALNSQAQFNMNHDLSSLYVLDSRAQTSSSLTAVRVVNGATLPDDGLTVATPQPLYVQGNFNLNNGNTTPGLTDTTQTKAAALIGDSITVLSKNWSDANATATLGSRTAANTTVNAAFLAGIVTTKQANGVKHYSGGVENFPRFLENWSSSTLTYNGSMVVMFPSRYATNFWFYGDPVYTAPTRRWAFDVNFMDPTRLPPMTPQVRKLIRGRWAVL
jgi:hypothetical protein